MVLDCFWRLLFEVRYLRIGIQLLIYLLTFSQVRSIAINQRFGTFRQLKRTREFFESCWPLDYGEVNAVLIKCGSIAIGQLRRWMTEISIPVPCASFKARLRV